jgi:hypothetical protein
MILQRDITIADTQKLLTLSNAELTNPSASPQECLGIILGAPGSSPAPEATLERGAPSKGSDTTGLEEVH